MLDFRSMEVRAREPKVVGEEGDREGVEVVEVGEEEEEELVGEEVWPLGREEARCSRRRR